MTHATVDVTHLDKVFSKNNYKCDFVRRNTYRAEPNVRKTNATPVPTATIPYIKGTSESIARIPQPYNNSVAHNRTHHHLTTSTNKLFEDKDEPKYRQGAVYNAATAKPHTLVR